MFCPLTVTIVASLVAPPTSQPSAAPSPVPSVEGRVFLDFNFGMHRREIEAILRDPTSRMRSLTAPEFNKHLEGLLEEMTVKEVALSLAGEKISADFGF